MRKEKVLVDKVCGVAVQGKIPVGGDFSGVDDFALSVKAQVTRCRDFTINRMATAQFKVTLIAHKAQLALILECLAGIGKIPSGAELIRIVIDD